MLELAQLSTIATALETAAGASTSANDNRLGLWSRIASAAEALSGVPTSANDNLMGRMQRTAAALELIAGTSGAEENTNYEGFLKRITDALEVQAGAVTTGSMEGRFVTAAQNAGFLTQYALALDFKRLQYRSGTTYKAGAGKVAELPAYSYTRATAKSELAASSGLVSFAANTPGVVSSIGYWSRPSLTNYLLQSQNFSLTWGTSAATVTADQIIAPDGNLTADLMAETAVNTEHYVQQTVTVPAINVAQTLSVFAKSTTGRFLNLQMFDAVTPANFSTITFDLSGAGAMSAVLNSGTASGASGVITYVGDGWYRCSLTSIVSSAVGTSVLSRVRTANALSTSGAATSFLGDIASGIYLWHAQLVAGSQPGPVIFTTAASVTVGPDVLSLTSVPVADEDFVMWVSLDLNANTSGIDIRLFTITDGTSNNRIGLYRTSGNTTALFVISGGVSQAINSPAAPTVTTGRTAILLRRSGGKWSSGFKANGSALMATNTAAAGAMPAVTQIGVGHENGGSQARSPIGFLAIRKGTFTDADCLAILNAA